jgi:hypothetical protein
MLILIKIREKEILKMFTCDDCGNKFKDFRNGGYIQNLKTHCPNCVGNKTFTVTVNGVTTQKTFSDAMAMLRGLK